MLRHSHSNRSNRDTFLVPAYYGTSHFSEIGYVFYNLGGQGYAKGQEPFLNVPQKVLDLAKLTSRMWISFIHDLDPNNHGSKFPESQKCLYRQI